MAGKVQRLFVPFGECKPDGKQFNNDGLLRATNVAPIQGTYVPVQKWTAQGDRPSDEPYGLHVHFAGGTTWYGYLGTITKLYEGNTSGTVVWALTDKTRAVGGPYATSSVGGENGWQGTSFGDSVVMTNYVDDPQLLTSPAAANYMKLAQSGGVNPGMDPKAKFVFPIRGNLFLANCNLGAGFDGLPAGANPTLVAWSQSENIRQYGSFNATPELVGSGYQNISYDFGHITGGIGGDYGLVALQGGWVRIDGPPYQFRPVGVGRGCRFPNSIVRIDADVYFWGAAGPSVLRNGEGVAETLGSAKILRALTDNFTSFTPYAVHPTIEIRHVCAGRDILNQSIWWSFTSVARTEDGSFIQIGDLSIIYNVNEDRFGFAENRGPIPGDGVSFLRTAPDTGGMWMPGRDLVGVEVFDSAGSPGWALAVQDIETKGSPLLQRAFQQLSSEFTTRIRRIRPVYSRSDTLMAVLATVSLTSKNRPYENGLSLTASTLDTQGWIVTPDSVFADFHQIQCDFSGAGLSSIVELEGCELEFETGGVYSA